MSECEHSAARVGDAANVCRMLGSNSSLLKVLFAKRRARFKWLVALPGAVALLFLGHAFEDDGIVAAAPYVAVVLMSTLYLFRPMLILWAPMFAAFVFYTVTVLVYPDNGPRSEWIMFLLLGIVPAVVLWLARPGHFVDAPNLDHRA